MLGGSDRLRIIAKILDLSEENFLKLFSSAKKRAVADTRESVHGWWIHRRDPVRDQKPVVQALQAHADELGKSLNIAQLWKNKKLTPGEFASACGGSIFEVIDAMSPVLQRSYFEFTDKLPFLALIRREMKRRGRPKIEPGAMAGTYDLYRIHSSARELCLELLQIDQAGEGIAPTGTYVQYKENPDKEKEQSRTIGLSLLTEGQWIHTVGAYLDSEAAGQPFLSLVHITIIALAYRKDTFAGLLHDVIDNKSAVAAQRILLVKREAPVDPTAFTPSLLKFISDDQIMRYVKFLRLGSDQLIADYNRMATILDEPITADDRHLLLS